MTIDDMPEVMAMERELFPDDAWSPDMFVSELTETAQRLYLVAETVLAETVLAGTVLAGTGPAETGPAGTGQLTGYAGMLFTGGPEADVLTLAVGPAYWGKGTGTALLQALFDEAARRQCTQIFLEVREDNQRARSLYLRHGFAEIGVRRGYYQPAGVDAIVMRKDLDQ
jgi:[ribosomal protein S18]-alanine N-acetyltransferase